MVQLLSGMPLKANQFLSLKLLIIKLQSFNLFLKGIQLLQPQRENQ
jgi:hypothetical protein